MQKDTMRHKILHNGLQIPMLGFGTARMEGRVCEQAVLDALEAGYTLIDTAQMYHNHKDIVRALKASGLQREKYFIQTKLSRDMSKVQAQQAIQNCLKELEIDFIDLLLIHEPYTSSPFMWEAMEEAYQKGLLKAIGISNFNIKQYNELLTNCTIKPMLNQVESHIFYQQRDLYKILSDNECLIQAWSPFGAGKRDFFNTPLLLELGEAYHKSSAQIALRFLVEQGILAIPKSSNKQRMKENLDIFDFSLSNEDMQRLEALDTDTSLFGWY